MSNVPLSITDMFVIDHKENISTKLFVINKDFFLLSITNVSVTIVMYVKTLSG